MAWNVVHLAEKFGLEYLGFLTLTFRDDVTDPAEAQRRIHSFITHVIGLRYRGYIRVYERQKSGRIHYHLLVVLNSDIRTGVDFEAFARIDPVTGKGDYRTASKELRSEWLFLRKAAKAHGFGRTELLPIKSTAEGIGRYVGKYIGKHMDCREQRDKGVRLVDYSRSARMANTKFAWVTPGAKLWRLKVKAFVETHAASWGLPATFDSMRVMHGPRWAFHWREVIAAYPVEAPEQGEGQGERSERPDPAILAPKSPPSRWGVVLKEPPPSEPSTAKNSPSTWKLPPAPLLDGVPLSYFAGAKHGSDRRERIPAPAAPRPVPSVT